MKEAERIKRLLEKRHKKACILIMDNIGDAKLMIIFDIPEDLSAKRQKFRNILKDWQVVQVQKSVWVTNKDFRDELAELIREMDLGGFVKLYECALVQSK